MKQVILKFSRACFACACWNHFSIYKPIHWFWKVEIKEFLPASISKLTFAQCIRACNLLSFDLIYVNKNQAIVVQFSNSRTMLLRYWTLCSAWFHKPQTSTCVILIATSWWWTSYYFFYIVEMGYTLSLMWIKLLTFVAGEDVLLPSTAV